MHAGDFGDRLAEKLSETDGRIRFALPLKVCFTYSTITKAWCPLMLLTNILLNVLSSLI